jgi:hypothetical protein
MVVRVRRVGEVVDGDATTPGSQQVTYWRLGADVVGICCLSLVALSMGEGSLAKWSNAPMAPRPRSIPE